MSSPQKPIAPKFGSHRSTNLSNWRQVRVQRDALTHELRAHHALRLHGACIGLLVVGFMLGVARLQWSAGFGSLALRYAVTLLAGYLLYLLLLRLWGTALTRPNKVKWDVPGDIPLPISRRFGGRSGGGDSGDSGDCKSSVDLPAFRSGSGGDFGGGGAQGSFDGGLGDAGLGEVPGKVAEGALELAAGADEGAVVVVPVVIVFLAALAALLGAGWLMAVYFGSEALLAVALELAFGYAAARTAVRVSREGWLSAAVRLTWKPLLGALVCAVAFGAAIDVYVPQAKSLPEAVAILRQAR